MVRPTVISLFAGCGGSSLGHQWAGYKELLAIDFDKNAVETFKLNFDVPIWERDVKEVAGEEILKFCKIKKGGLDLLDASPPCQGFSTAGKRKVNDSRNELFLEFVRLIKELQPKVFVMENVSGMVKGKMKGLFIEIMQILKSLNYNVKCKLLNAMYYEVPQSRQRLVWMGIKNDLKTIPSFPVPSKNRIVFKNATKGMPVQKTLSLSKCFLKIIPKMKQGEAVSDYIPGKHFQTQRIYNNRVCPTITKIIGGVGFGSLIHPIEDRVLSIDEIKRVCSYPDDFHLIGKYQEQKARLGNSVMPKFMYHIANHIKTKVFNKI